MYAQVLLAVIGIWMMVAPALLGFEGAAETNHRIVGPLLSSLMIISWWHATRAIRFLCLPLGLWMFFCPFFLWYTDRFLIIHDMLIGIFILALCPVRGEPTKRYGGGWASLFNDH